MKKRILALALAAVMLVALSACSASSTSTSTVSTTVNGQTTTTTTTTTASTESGVNTTTTTETSSETADKDDPTGLRARWYELFDAGAEGTNADGENFLFICNADSSYGGLMIVDKSLQEQEVYVFGEMDRDEEDGNAYVIHDVEDDVAVRFWVQNSEDDSFDMVFKDGDVAHMEYVGLDAIINDMVTLIESGVAH